MTLSGANAVYVRVQRASLNPSFSGWPSLGMKLLLAFFLFFFGLNPSFSGWPSLGLTNASQQEGRVSVLIPLLVDDPLWAVETEMNGVVTKTS